MGNRNIEVGNNILARKRGQPKVEGLGSEEQSPLHNPSQAERPKICGAMALQCGDGGRGNESAPQKFLQLVGCGDRKVRPEPWVRPRPIPPKR